MDTHTSSERSNTRRDDKHHIQASGTSEVGGRRWNQEGTRGASSVPVRSAVVKLGGGHGCSLFPIVLGCPARLII